MKLHHRVWAAMAVAAAVAFAVPACAATPSEADTDVTSMTIATSWPIDDLDPLNSGFWGPEFGYVELLMRPEPDGNPTPWVLSDLEMIDDTTWNLTLNEGVTFVNGRSFDGEALADLLTWTAENNANFASTANFASAEATGELEVALKTTAPTPTMANILAEESNVLVFDLEGYQEHQASGADPAALLEAGIYSGPYQVTTLNPQKAEMKPVDAYWAGTPALDSVTIKFVPEASARVQGVQAGEVDIALYIPAEVAQTLEGRTDAYFLSGTPTGLVHGLMSRVISPNFEDERVRRAFYSSIDYRSIAEDVLKGHAGLATSVFPSGFPYAVDTQKTDIAAANSELEAAGWTLGRDGFREKNGERLTIRLLATPTMPDTLVISQAIQAQAKEAGIDVQIVQVDDIYSARDEPNWEVSFASSLLTFSGAPDQGITELLTTGGPVNYAKISDPELDALAGELRQTFDTDRRHEILGDIQRIVSERGYFAVAAQRILTVVAGPDWQGYTVPVANLWVDAKTRPSA